MFKQHDDGQEIWYMGTHFLDKYVVTFAKDSTTNQTSVSFGLKNKSALQDSTAPAPPATTTDPATAALNSELSDLAVKYSLYDQTLRDLTNSLNSLQSELNLGQE